MQRVSSLPKGREERKLEKKCQCCLFGSSGQFYVSLLISLLMPNGLKTWGFVYLDLGPSSAWALGHRTSCPTPRAGTDPVGGIATGPPARRRFGKLGGAAMIDGLALVGCCGE